jgi:hypothetical protein
MVRCINDFYKDAFAPLSKTDLDSALAQMYTPLHTPPSSDDEGEPVQGHPAPSRFASEQEAIEYYLMHPEAR